MNLPDLQQLTDKLVREHGLAHERLTEKQIADAIRQALLAGDFTMHVVAETGAQTVTYIPYQGVEELRDEVRRLKSLIESLTEGDKPSE